MYIHVVTLHVMLSLTYLFHCLTVASWFQAPVVVGDGGNAARTIALPSASIMKFTAATQRTQQERARAYMRSMLQSYVSNINVVRRCISCSNSLSIVFLLSSFSNRFSFVSSPFSLLPFLFSHHQPHLAFCSPTVSSQQNTSQFANLIYETKTVHQFDRDMRMKNVIMAVIGIVQCILMVAMLEYPYNDATYIYEESVELEYLEIVQSVLTAILLYRVYDYYKTLVELERVRFNLPGNSSVLRSSHIYAMTLELLICLFHPVPFAGLRKLGLLMFLRLFILLRVYRDFSHIYRWRRDIMSAGGIRAGVIKYDAALSIRTLFYKSPLIFVLLVIAVALCFFSYTIYISERDSAFIKFKSWNQNDSKGLLTNMSGALWYTASLMTTVGYGDLYCVTRWGQAFSALAALAGICCSGLVIMGFVTSFALDFNEKFSADFCELKRLAIREKHLAANLLQQYFKQAMANGRLRRFRRLRQDIAMGKEVVIDVHAKPTLKERAALDNDCCGNPRIDPVVEAAQKFRKYRLMAAQEIGQEDVTQLKHILTLKRSAELTSLTVEYMRKKQTEIEWQTQRTITTLISTVQALLTQHGTTTGQSLPLFVNENTGEAQLDKDVNAQICYFYP